MQSCSVLNLHAAAGSSRYEGSPDESDADVFVDGPQQHAQGQAGHATGQVEPNCHAATEVVDDITAQHSEGDSDASQASGTDSEESMQL